MDSTSNPDTHESCMQYLLFPQMNLHCRQKSGYQDPDDGRQRFLLELEIRSCLINPTYIPLYLSIPFCYLNMIISGYFSKGPIIVSFMLYMLLDGSFFFIMFQVCDVFQ